jgi:hypothetical protein
MTIGRKNLLSLMGKKYGKKKEQDKNAKRIKERNSTEL